MTLGEAILDKVRRFPPGKQEDVLRFADGSQTRAKAGTIIPARDLSLEMRRIDENLAAHAGE